MSKLRKKLITVLAVLFCALLTISTALLIPKNKSAEANSFGTEIEIYDSSANRFSAKELRKLYGKICSDTINYKQLSSKLGNTKGTVLRAHTQITSTTVKLGDYKWNVVAVSKNQSGEVIATLWLAESLYTSTFSSGSFISTSTSTYAPCEYGMSLVRSTLVKDAEYATSSTDKTGSGNTVYNQYWKSFVEKFGSFIDTPIQVCGNDGYQATERATQYAGLVNLTPNEAYNIVEGGNVQSDSGVWVSQTLESVQHCTGYGNWGGDKLWLPSISEVGRENSDGLYCINNSTVRADSSNFWLRSGESGNIQAVFGLNSSGNFERNLNTCNNTRGVRPALHLNLKAVAESAKGVSYDYIDPTNVDESTKNVTNTEKGHIFTHTYDGNKVEVELLDHANLTIVGDDYSQSSGKFTAEYPEQKPDASGKGDKTYTISVTPNTGYVWDDTDQGGTREYKITVSLAEMSIDPMWGDTACALGESLLPDTTAIKVKGTESTPTVVYYVGEPTASPPDVSTWETEDVGNFTATKTGKNRVHYQVSADFHKNLKGFYDVTVSADTEITLTGSIDDTATTYGNETAEDLLDLLKGKFSGVTFTGNNSGVYDTARVSSLWDDTQIVLYSDGKEVSPQSNGYYAAGTYEVYLKYKNSSLSFKWDIDHPKVTIDKKAITVKIVAKDGGDLTHIYGDTPVEMKLQALDPSDFVGSGDDKDDETSLGTVTFKTDKGALINLTAADEYRIDADIIEVNYAVELLSKPKYVITARSITLRVADETVGYGTDLVNHKFKDMELEEGKIISGSGISLDTLTENASFYLLINDAQIELSNNLAIGDYVLSAKAEAANYDITVIAGKLTVEKGTFDLSGVTLTNTGYIYDGDPKPAKLNGELPSDEIKVSYRYVNYNTGEELDSAPVEVGLYLVYASFSHDNSNYNVITEVKAAYIRIAYTQEELNQAYPDLPTDADLAAAADLAKKKDEAKKTLDEEAKKKKDEIDADVNLTPEEKKAAKDEIDEELKKGNEAIDKAKDKDGVNKAYDDGKKEIEDTAELVEKKGAAKSELDKAAQAKKDAIDANPELTDEEKQAAKDKVDEELAKGKAEINGATDISGVQSAESSTKTNIENIKPEHKGGFPWWILAVIAGAIVLLTVIVIVVVKKRNSDDDDDGYDDFYDDEYDYEEEEESDDGDEAYGF